MRSRKKGNFWFKFSIFIAGFILFFFFALPLMLKDPVSKRLRAWVEANINGTMSYSDIQISMLPLSFTVHDLKITGAAPFEKETLFASKEIVFAIDILKFYQEKKIDVTNILFDKTEINILIDEKGNANYNMYKGVKNNDTIQTDTVTTAKNEATKIESVSFQSVKIIDSKIHYVDMSLPIDLELKNFSYEGNGDFDKAVYDIQTKLHIDSVNLVYDGIRYIKDIPVDVKFISSVDSKSLSFSISETKLTIDKLPIELEGKFGLIENGYNLDFSIKSDSVVLKDIINAFPKSFVQKLSKTKIDGDADFKLSVNGKYLVDSTGNKTLPTANFSLNLRNGYLAGEKAKLPVRDMSFNMNATIPNGNADSALLKLDNFKFFVKDDYFKANLFVKGTKKPYIKLDVNSNLDLGVWEESIDLQGIDLKGKLNLLLNADGVLDIVKSDKKEDTKILSIPNFNLKTSLDSGYFKLDKYPSALKNISINANAQCYTNKIDDINIQLENINIELLENYVKGYFNVHTSKGYPIDTKIESSVKLKDLKNIVSLDSLGLDIDGNVNISVFAKGKTDLKKDIFPKVESSVKIENGYIKKQQFDSAIEKINTDIFLSCGTKNGSDFNLNIKQLDFIFQDKPFSTTAHISNLQNIKYDIASKGSLDLSNLMKLIDNSSTKKSISGIIDADFHIIGTQSDIKAKRFDKLTNSGGIKLTKVSLSSDIYQHPLNINNGEIRFGSGNINLINWIVNFGSSMLTVDGYVNNIPNFIIKGENIKGNISLYSNNLNIDEFRSVATETNNKESVTETKKENTNASNTQSGVIQLPKNIDFNINANIKKLKFGNLKLDSITTIGQLQNGELWLKNLGFSVIGSRVDMWAKYKDISSEKAKFEYNIVANNFDVQRAYKEVEFFKTMCPSAESAYGIISLEYYLKGTLDKNMQPILPSIEGNGSITLNNIELKGMKMFSEISSSADAKDMKNPKMQGVVLKTNIKNNIINIEHTEFTFAKFSNEISGQSSLDGQLRLQYRLGFPLGLVHVNISVTGTSENPVISMGKKAKKSEPLKETIYEEI